MEYLPLIKDSAAAVAIIVVVGQFLSHISKERKRDRDLWVNHLSKVSESLERNVTLLDILVDEVRLLRTVDLVNTGQRK